jgi:hypothetical protein
VRFVSTPELLERFVTIEREIVQIENSIQSSESAEADGMVRDIRMYRSLVKIILWMSLRPTNQLHSQFVQPFLCQRQTCLVLFFFFFFFNNY